jgi:hypothetical protein
MRFSGDVAARVPSDRALTSARVSRLRMAGDYRRWMRVWCLAIVLIPNLRAALGSVTACDTCNDEFRGSCRAECNGTWSEAECRCVCPPSTPPTSPPRTCETAGDFACARGEHCRFGRCTTTACVNDGDCIQSGACDRNDGICRRACETNEACAPGFRCDDHVCVAAVIPCGPGLSCPGDRVCEADTGTCAPGCGEDSLAPCLAPYTECVDRAGAKVCLDADYRSCIADTDCRFDTGATCFKGRCFAPAIR